MTKATIAAVIAVLALVALAVPVAAQVPNCPVDNPTFYDPDGVCPNQIDRPGGEDPAVGPNAVPSGGLPRTGAGDSLPLARMAIVLIAVGGALALMADRKRRQHAPA